MRKIILTGGLVAFGVLASAAALAEDASGFYVGAGVGQTNLEVDLGDTILADFDSDDVSFKLVAGYAFNSHFALELAYFDGGSPDQDFGPVTLDISLDGVNVSALGRLPLGETFSLFGKLGYAFYDVEVTGRSDGFSVSESGSDEDLTYAVGAALAASESFELRAEYEAVDISDGNLDSFTVSGVFRF